MRERRVKMASGVVLSAAFALTGFATALPGATLPAMLARWSLTDRRGGMLFLVVFLGSSLGALASRGRPAYSVARGLGLLAVAAGALGLVTGAAVFPLCFCYGLGLGITITSISLLRSERCAERRAAEMNRLNLIWALGAFCCPWAANEMLRWSGVRGLWIALGVVFAAVLLWMLAVEVRWQPGSAARVMVVGGVGARLPFVIGLVTFFAVGLESSMGAWIATYAERLRSGFEAPVAAGSVFWFGLLASRAVHSTGVVRRFREEVLLRVGTAVAAVGCLFLVTAGGQAGLLVAGFLIGFGVGPVYPLLQAAVLPRIAGNTIFLMAGMGGATFPLVIGLVSSRVSSLRVGMMVPAVAGVGMACLVGMVLGRLNGMEGGVGNAVAPRTPPFDDETVKEWGTKGG